MNNIFEYVRNRTVVEAPLSDIVEEVIERYSPEILFPEVSNEDLKDILTMLAKYAYFLYHNKAYDRP